MITKNPNHYLYKLLCLMQEVENFTGTRVDHAAKKANLPHSERTLYKIFAETRDAVDVFSIGSHQDRRRVLGHSYTSYPNGSSFKTSSNRSYTRPC